MKCVYFYLSIDFPKFIVPRPILLTVHSYEIFIFRLLLSKVTDSSEEITSSEEIENKKELQCSDQRVITKFIMRLDDMDELFDFVYIDNQLKSIGHLLIIECSCSKRLCSENCCYGRNTTLKECEKFTFPFKYWRTEQLCGTQTLLVEFELFAFGMKRLNVPFFQDVDDKYNVDDGYEKTIILRSVLRSGLYTNLLIGLLDVFGNHMNMTIDGKQIRSVLSRLIASITQKIN